MSSLIVKVGAHLYAEEELCDEYFDFPKTARSINPPEMMRPLRRIRDKFINIGIHEGVTVAEFEDQLNASIWGVNWKEIALGAELFYDVGYCRAEITNRDCSFTYLLDKYLDPNKTGIISVAYYVSEDAGDVYVEGNLRFYMHSNEQGHNIPHVHVTDKNTYNQCSISIMDGELLATKEFRKKDLKEARRIIAENRDFFIDCWNKITDGIKIDINHQLGFIKY